LLVAEVVEEVHQPVVLYQEVLTVLILDFGAQQNHFGLRAEVVVVVGHQVVNLDVLVVRVVEQVQIIQ
jgi:hypothetical protein